MRQPALFGWGEPAIDPGFASAKRVALDATGWVEHVVGWVEGHEVLFEALAERIAWRTEERPMYDRVVAVPRLLGSVPEGGVGLPVLEQMRAAFAGRYR